MKYKYTATFSDGHKATRTSDNMYLFAWRRVFSWDANGRRHEQSGFSSTQQLAQNQLPPAKPGMTIHFAEVVRIQEVRQVQPREKRATAEG